MMPCFKTINIFYLLPIIIDPIISLIFYIKKKKKKKIYMEPKKIFFPLSSKIDVQLKIIIKHYIIQSIYSFESTK